MMRMLRTAVLLLGAVLPAGVPVQAMARQAMPAAQSASAAHAPPVPLLWKVSGVQGSTLYLLGSFHLLKPEDYPLSPDVDAAFNAARRLLLELPPEELDSPELAAQMLRAAMRRDGRQLKDDLDAVTWQRLQAYAAGNGLPLERLSGMKPWFVGLTISLAQMARQGLDPQAGLDRHLMTRAIEVGKPATGLENAAAQIAMLDGMSNDEQRQLLREALEQVDKGDEQSRRLHDAWRRGDDGGHRLGQVRHFDPALAGFAGLHAVFDGLPISNREHPVYARELHDGGLGHEPGRRVYARHHAHTAEAAGLQVARGIVGLDLDLECAR